MQRHRKSVQMANVQRAEIRMEGIVQQALVDGEVDGRVVLRTAR